MSNTIRSFKQNIKILFLKYTLIPILILFLLFSIFIVLIAKINIAINTKQANTSISKEINEIYDNYYNELNRMSSSDNTISYVQTHLQDNLIYDEYYKFVNSQKVKSVMNIIDTRGVFLMSTDYSDAETQKYLIDNIIPKLDANSDNILSELNALTYQYNKKTTYTFAKAIQNNGTIIGYLIYQLYEDDFQSLLFKQNNELAIITNSHNRIISTNNNSVKGLMNKFNPKYLNSTHYVDILNGTYYIYKNSIKDDQLYVYTLNSMTIKNNIFYIYFSFIILVSLLITILINHLANKMASNNSASIDALIHSVNELKHGNMNSYVNITSGDEFELLAHEFNIMLDTLNELMRKNEELISLSYISEINLLQSQFNPHFIFNVLETLKYSLVLAPKDSEEIILGLSRLLRYSINYDSQKVILNKDLCYIEDYFKLSKFRFKDRLKYNIKIADKAKKALIPKLLLQVIVENSIKYGFKDKDNLEINIIGYIKDNNLILNVKDNGSGISKEQLANVKALLNSTENTSNHIGLHNAYRRLVLLYGSKQLFEIKSILGKGTSINLIIPYEEEDLNV